MNLEEQRDLIRRELKRDQLKNMFAFIDKASFDEVALVIAEILCVHDNLLVFNSDKKSLDRVESVSLNGGFIQLNLEKQTKGILCLEGGKLTGSP